MSTKKYGKKSSSSVSLETVSLEKMEEVERMFTRFDANKDGKICKTELGDMLRALGTKPSEYEVDEMMKEIDLDGDGFIDLKEFADFHKKSGIDGDDSHAADRVLRDAFDMYDKDKNGLISATELHMVMKSLGEKCSYRDCSRMIGSVDADGDGSVNYEEFKKMMNPH